jgi:hypothetical protein
VDSPVPELRPPAGQDRPHGNRPLRVRLDLVVTRHPSERGEGSALPRPRRQVRMDERRINVTIDRQKMGNRSAGRRAAGPDAYGLLQEILFDLRQAERALSLIEEAAPDQERALHLGAIRTAIAQMATFVWPVSAT